MRWVDIVSGGQNTTKHTVKNVPQEPYAEDPRAWRGCTWDPGRILSHRGAAAPRTPRSELSRFAPGPRAPNSQQKQHAGKQNHQKSNQKYKNNKPKGAGAKRPPPWGAAEGGTLLFLLFLIAFLMILLAGMLFFL